MGTKIFLGFQKKDESKMVAQKKEKVGNIKMCSSRNNLLLVCMFVFFSRINCNIISVTTFAASSCTNFAFAFSVMSDPSTNANLCICLFNKGRPWNEI